MKLLIFDTETTGLPKSREQAIKGANNWPHLVSIAWIIVENDKIIKSEYHIVRPLWDIPDDSVKIHGITKEKALAEGTPLSTVMMKFLEEPHDIMIAHNMSFDYNVLINAIMWDLKLIVLPDFKRRFCTMEAMRNVMCLPFANGRGYKPPKLSELYAYVTNKSVQPQQLHNSLYDTQLLAEIMIRSTYLKTMIGLPISGDDNPNASKKARTTLIL
jgi:DNA polymerase III epsilon subunit-like protein